MKILVTGGTGFIGMPLVRALAAKGNKVIVFAREDDAYLPEGAHIVCGDMNHKASLRKAFFNIDAVYHLASAKYDDHGMHHDKDIAATEKLIELCREHKVKQLIYLSFAGVLGDTKAPAKEHSMHKPATKYEKAKSSCENMIKNSGLDYTIIRAPLIMGASSFWFRTVLSIREGHPIVGDGQNKMHVIHADDVVRILTNVLGNKKAINHVFHVGTKDLMTWGEMHDTIRKELRMKGEQKHMSYRKARAIGAMHWIKSAALKRNPQYHLGKEYLRLMSKNYALSIQKAYKELGFVPNYTTPQAIHEMIEEIM
jgi:nucleoside-diphosphate-sugar epimerase